MSQLSEAKKRMFLKSNSIFEAEEQDNQIPIFTRNNTNNSNLNIQMNQYDTRSLSKKRFPQQNFHKKDLSPSFAKTDRWAQKSVGDRFQSKSEQPYQINLFGQQKKRRGTLDIRHRQAQSPTIRDVSFTQQDQSLYNESPIKQIKETVHKEHLDLIVSKQPSRVAISPVKPRQCILVQINKLMHEQKTKNQNFTDRIFPPKFSIIYNKRYMYIDEGIYFERIPQIFENHKIAIIKFSEPTYLTMGKFTSCAVYSALSILAQQPTLVLNLLGNQQVNHHGIYYIYLCKDGVWRYIIIDDFLPLKSGHKKNPVCIYSKPHNNMTQIWAPLIEKALAKIYGTYQDLYLTASQGIKQIMTNLTGLPISEYTINKDFRAFLVVIDTALKRKHIVVLQNIKQEYLEAAMLKKLDPGLSYKIVEVKKSYIVLRNLQQRDIITKLTFQQAMIFNSLLIFRWENNFTYLSRTLRHKISYFSSISFKVQKSLKCYWSVHQNSKVYYKNHIGSKIQYQQSPYTIILKQQSTDDISQTQKQYITGNMQIIPGKQVQLKQGTYNLCVHLCQQKQLDFNLVYYGQKQIKSLQRIRCNQKWNLQCQCQIDSY